MTTQPKNFTVGRTPVARRGEPAFTLPPGDAGVPSEAEPPNASGGTQAPPGTTHRAANTVVPGGLQPSASAPAVETRGSPGPGRGHIPGTTQPRPGQGHPALTRLASLPPWPAPPDPADVLLQVRLGLPPVAAARPRVSPAEYTRIGGQKVKTKRAHGYTPQAYEDYKRDVGWLFRLARVTRNDTDQLGVYGIFHLPEGAGAADGDNLLKAAVDAGNGIGWKDDRQFVTWLAQVVRGSGDPHTDLVVYVVRSAGLAGTRGAG